MGIHDEAHHDAIGVAQHDISSLARHAWQRQHLLHCARHLAAIAGNQALRGGAKVFGLVAVKSGRFDVLFQLFLADGRVILYAAILLEEANRDKVDALIGTLSRKLCSNQQFKRVGEVERTFGVGIQAAQLGDDGANLFWRRGLRPRIGWWRDLVHILQLSSRFRSL